jgi:hypothetical protein
MPTTAQVLNRRRPPAEPDRHYTATVTAAGPPATVALDPGGTATIAQPLDAATYTVGARVLILITAAGNYILGRIT